MHKSIFSEEEQQFIRDNVKGRTVRELYKLYKKKYNNNITYTQLKNWKRNNNLKCEKRYAPPKLFTEEQEKYFFKILKNKTTKELAVIMNNKYNCKFTPQQIKNYKKHHNLKSYNINGEWRIGKKTINHKPVGSEIISYINGYKNTFIKVAEPNTWERKQHYMYKKYFGEIPKGCAIIFLNGNRDDFSKDNLGCVTMEEHKFMASNELYFNDIDLTKMGIDIARLKIKIKERKVK